MSRSLNANSPLPTFASRRLPQRWKASRRGIWRLVLVWLPLVFTPPLVHAQPMDIAVELVDLQGQQHAGRIANWTAESITLQTPNGELLQFPTENCYRIQFPNVPGNALTETENASRSRAAIELTNGDVLFVNDVQIREDTLECRWIGDESTGVIQIPLVFLRSLTLRSSPETWSGITDADLQQDAVWLTNGDRLLGLLTKFEDDQVTVHVNGKNASFSSDQVALILLNPRLSEVVSQPHKYLFCNLQNGSTVTASWPESVDGKLQLKLPAGPQVTLPFSEMSSLEMRGPRVASLRDGATSVTSFDYFGSEQSVTWNQTASGVQLSVAGERHRAGICVPTQTRLNVSIPARAEVFLGQVGLDDSAGPWAAADIAIEVDGQRVWARAGLMPQDGLLQVPTISIRGGRQISLIADFGPRADIQDVVDWIEPVIVLEPANESSFPTSK